MLKHICGPLSDEPNDDDNRSHFYRTTFRCNFETNVN